mgnify:FL=1
MSFIKTCAPPSCLYLRQGQKNKSMQSPVTLINFLVAGGKTRTYDLRVMRYHQSQF